ncbi:MAG: hypothetical protein ACRDD1_21590, partial [Planctomycetia bacterium]
TVIAAAASAGLCIADEPNQLVDPIPVAAAEQGAVRHRPEAYFRRAAVEMLEQQNRPAPPPNPMTRPGGITVDLAFDDEDPGPPVYPSLPITLTRNEAPAVEAAPTAKAPPYRPAPSAGRIVDPIPTVTASTPVKPAVAPKPEVNSESQERKISALVAAELAEEQEKPKKPTVTYSKPASLDAPPPAAMPASALPASNDERRAQAKKLMADVRRCLTEDDVAGAEMRLHLLQELAVDYGRLETSPADLLRDVDRLKRKLQANKRKTR